MLELGGGATSSTAPPETVRNTESMSSVDIYRPERQDAPRRCPPNKASMALASAAAQTKESRQIALDSLDHDVSAILLGLLT